MSGIQAQKTDPQLRFLLELSYEALVDAGMDIMKIRGSNAGVYVGSCFSDCHKGTMKKSSQPAAMSYHYLYFPKMAAWLQDCETITGYENTGCAQSMYANRLSFFYDFHGPSMNIDTACSSALVALVQACQAIESGEIDMALVGGSSITLHPGVRSIFM